MNQIIYLVGLVVEVIRSLPVRHRELGPEWRGSLAAARQWSRSDETEVAGITPT